MLRNVLVEESTKIFNEYKVDSDGFSQSVVPYLNIIWGDRFLLAGYYSYYCSGEKKKILNAVRKLKFYYKRRVWGKVMDYTH